MVVRRAAFTMLELLVVMTIITLMMTLLIGASWRFIAGSKESATATTILKISGIIDDRVRGLNEQDFDDGSYAFISQQYSQMTPSQQSASNYLSDVKLIGIYLKKSAYKRAFPQCFLEMPISQQVQMFGMAVPPTNSQYDPKYEPGIVLFGIISKGQQFGAATPASDSFTSAEVKISPETGNLPCFVDAWGEPLRFYRWPTRLLRCGEQGIGDYNLNGSSNDPAGTINLATGLQQASPIIRQTGTILNATPASLLISGLSAFDIGNPYSTGSDRSPGVAGSSPPQNTLGWPGSDDPEFLNQDPDDPMMRLTNAFSTPSNAVSFVIGSRLDNSGRFYVNAYHDPFTFWMPLIVSAGPDRQLGLYEPTDIPTAANPQSVAFGYLGNPLPLPASMNLLFDNVTNRNGKK